MSKTKIHQIDILIVRDNTTLSIYRCGEQERLSASVNGADGGPTAMKPEWAAELRQIADAADEIAARWPGKSKPQARCLRIWKGQIQASTCYATNQGESHTPVGPVALGWLQEELTKAGIIH